MWTVISCKEINKFGKIILRYVSGAAAPIQLGRALIVSKMTRYEVEQYRHPGLNESQLERVVRYRGSNYESLIDHHIRHKTYERYLVDIFNKMGITTRTVNRLVYSEESIKWCDVVFPVGGDGTFLLAASRITDNKKPVIGFNSDPLSSEGFLCLPKYYSSRIEEALQKLFKGEFTWLFRSRIRVTLCGEKIPDIPVSLHEKQLLGEDRLPFEGSNFPSKRGVEIGKCSILPVLALNEVFIGENLSAQVSYFELRTSPDDIITKVKSSGICVSTGTGSTSWHLSMNRITCQGVEQVLKCAGIDTIDFSEITKKYNDSLVFKPDDPRMSYTVRDLISAGVWPHPPGLAPRGFSKSLWIRSRCQDAGLVIDGGVSYPFNDGSVAILEIHPEDALCTVEIT